MRVSKSLRILRIILKTVFPRRSAQRPVVSSSSTEPNPSGLESQQEVRIQKKRMVLPNKQSCSSQSGSGGIDDCLHGEVLPGTSYPEPSKTGQRSLSPRQRPNRGTLNGASWDDDRPFWLSIEDLQRGVIKPRYDRNPYGRSGESEPRD